MDTNAIKNFVDTHTIEECRAKAAEFWQAEEKGIDSDGAYKSMLVHIYTNAKEMKETGKVSANSVMQFVNVPAA